MFLHITSLFGAESRGVPPGDKPTDAESHVDPPPIPSIGDESHSVPPMNLYWC